jgi:signal transduction histidine kinase
LIIDFDSQSTLFNILFERLPMGVAIIDCNYHIQRYNPTWEEFALRYPNPGGVPLTQGVGYFEHIPGTENIVLPLFERALSGEIVHENNICLESTGVVSYWDVVLAPLIENNVTKGLLNFAVDVTERTLLKQNLQRLVEDRTRNLNILLEVSSVANSSLNLDEILIKTLDLVVALVNASRVGVFLPKESTDILQPYLVRPPQDITHKDLQVMLTHCQSIFNKGEMLQILPDRNKELLEPGVLLPLQIKGRKLGVLVIIGSNKSNFSSDQLALFQSIAGELSMALEHARLFEKIEKSAIATERNRLARDLHDAVTQTLFSCSMIADVLPRLWEQNPNEGRRRLAELRQLTSGALSEMRTLLVELRPTVLSDIDLGDLVEHQVNAFIARSQVNVDIKIDCIQNPPIEVKEAIFRIVQETFNNIAKHANASQVNLILNCQINYAELIIKDNGVGFDPQALMQEGLGLGIMEERAQMVGAQIDIQSLVGNGTCLHIIWQAPN